jgi:hypothetical protein
MNPPHLFPSPVTRVGHLFPRLAMLVFLCAGLPAVRAAGEDKRLSVSIDCMAYADGLKAVFVKIAGDRYESVGLPTANIAEAAEALVEDGKHPVVANAEIGAFRQPMIVVHPAAKDAGLACDSKAVEADPKTFPLGSFNLVNLSHHPLRIVHEEVTIELESAGDRSFTPDHAAGE